MTGVARAVQGAVDTALLAAPGVVALLAVTQDGPAVFAARQPFPADAFPRVTLETPQVLPTADDGACGQGSLVYLTVHCWAQGPESTLVAGDLSDAVRAALDVALPLSGRRVSAHAFEGANPVGDPDDTIEHVVCTFRYSVRPSA